MVRMINEINVEHIDCNYYIVKTEYSCKGTKELRFLMDKLTYINEDEKDYEEDD